MDKTMIVDEILASKKYKSIIRKTVENISVSLADNVGDIRSKLHQIWGAYYKSRPRFERIIKKLVQNEFNVLDFCKVHSSTSERVVEYEKIFDFITKSTSGKSILDLGCGLNPLLFSLYSNQYDYLCIDIDIEQQEFLNRYFEKNKLLKFKADIGDALVGKYMNYDIVFLFKLLPVLDQISVEKCNELLSTLSCNYLVVTLPNKSLGGREKGMRENYRNTYVSRINDLGYELVNSNEFRNESVYIFKKEKPGKSPVNQFE